jgi:hypothetical protein
MIFFTVFIFKFETNLENGDTSLYVLVSTGFVQVWWRFPAEDDSQKGKQI